MALKFNGTTQSLVRLANIPDDAAFTLMGWINVTTWATDVTFFGIKVLNSATQRAMAQLDAVSGNRIKIWNGNVDTVGSSVLTAGTWYHVAMVGDGSNFKLYLDGILEVNAPTFGTP